MIKLRKLRNKTIEKYLNTFVYSGINASDIIRAMIIKMMEMEKKINRKI